MTKKEIRKKLINVIDERFNPISKIKDTDNYLNDYGMDSLDTLEFGMDIEREFDIALSDEEIKELSNGTVKDTIDFLYDFMKPFKED